MGGASSIAVSSPEEKYIVSEERKPYFVNNSDHISKKDSDSANDEQILSNKSKSNEDVTDMSINKPPMGLRKAINEMRFFQNMETSEVLFILGSDRIEDVPKLHKDEWFEVNVSGLQDDYVRQTMQSKSLAQRQLFNSEPMEETASLSTSFKASLENAPQIPKTSLLGHDDNIDNDDNDDDNNSHDGQVACNNSLNNDFNSVGSTGSYHLGDASSEKSNVSSLSSQPLSTKIKVPWECPHCDHTFSMFENKNEHIAACRKAYQQDTDTIKQWVELISQSNHDVMSEAITEAMRQFEEKANHRQMVLLLLKQLQKICSRGTVEQLQTLSDDISVEQNTLKLLLTPITPTNKANKYVNDRNEEINQMLAYLKKANEIITKKIASKNSLHIEDFTVGNILSSGSFSNVHLAKCKANGELFALKVMKREFLREQKLEHQIERECLVMEHTSMFPDMFLRLHFHDTRKDHVFILMEYVPTGDCLKLMKSMHGKLPVELAKHIIANLILAVSFLHSHGVVHRDIKPDNLLITPQGHVKLVDFGMASHHVCPTANANVADDSSLWLADLQNNVSTGVSSSLSRMKSETDLSLSSFRFGDQCDEEAMKTLVGNVNYAAPEILEGEGYDHSIDWWAVGVLYFHFVAGVPPFYAPSESETKYNVIEGNVDWRKVSGIASQSCQSFIADLLKPHPKQRLGSRGGQEVEGHEHFRGVDFRHILQKQGPFLPPEVEVDFKPLDVDFLV